MSKRNIVIVGSGLSGATLANKFANDGHMVFVYEKRDHIGGNVYDYTHDETNLLIGKYGAHIFHTSYEDVWKFVNKFTEFNSYEHKVLSKVDDKLVPVPVNITTVNEILGMNIKTEKAMKKWLEYRQGLYEQIFPNNKNSKEAALRRIGEYTLYYKMFKYYTYKQWAKYPEELEPSVLERIPIRTDYNDRYFSDKYEGIPKNGYTRMVNKMLNHKNIFMWLNYDFKEVPKDIEDPLIFYTGKIDSYFNDKFGALEYRSLRFEHEVYQGESFQRAAVVNYPQMDEDFTRIVEHKKIYQQEGPKTLITREYSSSTGEAYYPVPTERNRKIYAKYQKEAEKLEKEGIYFVGRLANYKYFNMDQAIKNALELYNKVKETT